MSSLWDVPAYIIMAFSLALDAPAEKASRVPLRTEAQEARSRDAVTLAEQPWLRAVKAASPHSAVLSEYARRIFVTSYGRYYVPNASERAEILALQAPSEVATRVLAAATIEFKAQLAKATGREPTRAALLVAHLYGTTAAVSYLRALEGAPQLPASAALPELAAAMGKSAAEPLALLDARMSAGLGGQERNLVAIGEVADAHTHKPAAMRTPSLARAPFMAGTLTKPEESRGVSKLAAR